MTENLTPEMFRSVYASVFSGDETWKHVKTPEDRRYRWEPHSTYIRKPTFFEGLIRPRPGRRAPDQGRARAGIPRETR
jgi:aconitase A